MVLEIRKRMVNREVVLLEGGRRPDRPHVIVTSAALIRNPWAGQGFVEDLGPVARAIAPDLAAALVPDLVDALGGPDHVEAYGKGATAGLAGEVEHAAALIHTLHFGNRVRDAVNGKSYLPFTNQRAGAGSDLAIPLVHKTDSGQRSHFMTAHIAVLDGPAEDEILVAIAAADGGRSFQRLGNRYTEAEGMAAEASTAPEGSR